VSSILTNNSAMVALDTLRNINKNLATVTNEISTGKKIGSAKDNAAIWAIATVMSTDVESFKQISDSLNLGNSTVGVARSASETVTSLLQNMKELIVSAQESNVDRSKIQTDVAALKTSIDNIVNAAQFNGQNLLKGTDSVASLDRAPDSTVSATKISVNRVDLSTSAAVDAADKAASDAGYTSTVDTLTTTDVAKAGGTAGTLTTVQSGTISDGANADVVIKAGALATGDAFTVNVGGADYTYTATAGQTINDVADGLKLLVDAGSIANLTVTVTPGGDPLSDDATINLAAAGGTVAFNEANLAATEVQSSISDGDDVAVTLKGGTLTAGDTFTVNAGGADYVYTAVDGDTNNTVAAGLKTLIDAGSVTNLTVTVTDATDPATDAATLTLTAGGGTVDANLASLGSQNAAVAAGGLGSLATLDVSTAEGATAALTSIETLLSKSISAATSFGSAQKQIENQNDFVLKLIDSMTSGIGSLTDADMEAASAKLQALQVQQQLSVQALSIANQGPQALLALFR
jgi:flagellin